MSCSAGGAEELGAAGTLVRPARPEAHPRPRGPRGPARHRPGAAGRLPQGHGGVGSGRSRWGGGCPGRWIRWPQLLQRRLRAGAAAATAHRPAACRGSSAEPPSPSAACLRCSGESREQRSLEPARRRQARCPAGRPVSAAGAAAAGRRRHSGLTAPAAAAARCTLCTTHSRVLGCLWRWPPLPAPRTGGARRPRGRTLVLADQLSLLPARLPACLLEAVV